MKFKDFCAAFLLFPFGMINWPGALNPPGLLLQPRLKIRLKIRETKRKIKDTYFAAANLASSPRGLLLLTLNFSVDVTLRVPGK